MGAMRRQALLLVILAALLPPPAARADVDPADWNYQLISPRGRARLVQTCRGPAACRAECFDQRRRRLWSVETAIGPKQGITVADDGVHVIRVTELLPAEGTGEVEVLAFYTRGKRVRGWRVKELVDKPEALPLVGQTRRFISDWRLSGDGRSFEISIVSGERRSFVVATGERKP